MRYHYIILIFLVNYTKFSLEFHGTNVIGGLKTECSMFRVETYDSHVVRITC